MYHRTASRGSADGGDGQGHSAGRTVARKCYKVILISSNNLLAEGRSL